MITGCLLLVVALALVFLVAASAFAAGGAIAAMAVMGIVILVWILSKIEKAIRSSKERQSASQSQEAAAPAESDGDTENGGGQKAPQRPSQILLDQHGRVDIEKAALLVAVGIGLWALVAQMVPIFWLAVALGAGAIYSRKVSAREAAEQEG